MSEPKYMDNGDMPEATVEYSVKDLFDRQDAKLDGLAELLRGIKENVDTKLGPDALLPVFARFDKDEKEIAELRATVTRNETLDDYKASVRKKAYAAAAIGVPAFAALIGSGAIHL